MTDKKPHLSVFGGPLGPLAPPSVDEARRQLGGPWVGGPDIGRVVRIVGGPVERVGVVVHSTPDDRDVWIGMGRVQRVEPARIEPAEADADHDPIIAAARVHASLSVGDSVVYELDDGGFAEGVLAEKLRFGALIGTPDGRVVAIGFRRIAPQQADPPS
ncbi:MAG: hypothetical protein R3B82_07530 [Sandaracinaceae bacterium]